MSNPARTIGAALTALFAAVAGCSEGTGPEQRPLDAVEIVTTAGSADLRVVRGETLALQARAIRDGGPVSGVRFLWRSETPEVATVDTLGVVEGLEFGTAQIVAEPVDVGGVVGRATVHVVGPPVASISIFPANPFIDLHDAVQYSAQALDAEGRPLSGVELTWRVVSGGIAMEGNGRVTGIAPGPARIEVEAWNGTIGGMDLRVTPVTALSPDTGRYGGVVGIEGPGLPPAAQVYFSGAGGSRVEAHVIGASPEQYWVWVPVDAVTGPLDFVSPTDTFSTSRRFQRTADDDIFPGCPPGGQCTLWLVPTNFSNPSLLVRADEFNWVGFELEETTPITIHLSHRGPPDVSRTIFAYLYRFRPGPTLADFDVGGQLWSYDPTLGTHVDSVTYSHPGLPPGIYGLRIAGVDVSGSLARMPYGLTILPVTSFANAPDAFEPNDLPQEASPTPITLPFSETALSVENRWAVDYYTFDLDEVSKVEATVTGANVDMDLYLMRGDTVDLYVALSNPNLGVIVTGSASEATTESLDATVPAGRYTLVAVEWGHGAGPYSLEVTAAPAPGSPFTLTPPSITPSVKAQRPSAAQLGRSGVLRAVPVAEPLRR